MSTATRPLADLPTITMDLAALLTYQPDVPTLDHVTHTGNMVPNPLNLPILRIWAPWLDTQLAASTAERYRRDLVQFARWVQVTYLVANPEELTCGIVGRWYLALDAERDAGTLSDAGLARKVVTLQRALRRAEREHVVRAGLSAVEAPIAAPGVVVEHVGGNEWMN